MIPKLAIAMMALSFVMTLYADFTADFQAAQTSFNRRKWKEATTAFEKIADMQEQGVKRDNALLKAVQARLKLGKGEYGNVMTVMEKISDPNMKKYAKLMILVETGKGKDAIAEFKNEKIEAWNEEFAYLGHYLRAVAWYQVFPEQTRDSAAMIFDYQKAVDGAGTDAYIKLQALESLCQTLNLSGNTAGALAAADKAIEMRNYSGFYAYISCVLQKTNILMNEKKFDEAAKILTDFGTDRKWGSKDPWHCRYLTLFGDLEAARGDTDKAKEYYSQAVATGTQKYFVDVAEKKLAGLK